MATRKQKISCRSSQRNIEESRRDSKFWGFIGPCGKVTRRCVTSWSTRPPETTETLASLENVEHLEYMLYVNYMCFNKGLVEFDGISCAWIQEGEGNEDLASIWPWDNLRSCWQDVSVETPYNRNRNIEILLYIYGYGTVWLIIINIDSILIYNSYSYIYTFNAMCCIYVAWQWRNVVVNGPLWLRPWRISTRGTVTAATPRSGPRSAAPWRCVATCKRKATWPSGGGGNCFLQPHTYGVV